MTFFLNLALVKRQGRNWGQLANPTQFGRKGKLNPPPPREVTKTADYTVSPDSFRNFFSSSERLDPGFLHHLKIKINRISPEQVGRITESCQLPMITGNMGNLTAFPTASLPGQSSWGVSIPFVRQHSVATEKARPVPHTDLKRGWGGRQDGVLLGEGLEVQTGGCAGHTLGDTGLRA